MPTILENPNESEPPVPTAAAGQAPSALNVSRTETHQHHRENPQSRTGLATSSRQEFAPGIRTPTSATSRTGHQERNKPKLRVDRANPNHQPTQSQQEV